MLELLAAAALPLGLLAVGAGLRFSASTLPLPALAWWHAVKLVAMPAVALALARALGLSPLETQIAVALAAVPTAPSAYILARADERPTAPGRAAHLERDGDRGSDAAAVDCAGGVTRWQHRRVVADWRRVAAAVARPPEH